MIAGIAIGATVLVGLVVCVATIVRDVLRLHASGRNLTDRPSDVAGVSAAGVTAIGNNVTH